MTTFTIILAEAIAKRIAHHAAALNVTPSDIIAAVFEDDATYDRAVFKIGKERHANCTVHRRSLELQQPTDD